MALRRRSWAVFLLSSRRTWCGGRTVPSGGAVPAALDARAAGPNASTLVCGNTLDRIGRSAPAPLTVLPQGAVLALAAMQAEGWTYIRA